MHSRAVMIYHAPGNQEVPGPLAEFARERGLRILRVQTVEEVLTLVNRSFPACIVTGGAGAESEALCGAVQCREILGFVPDAPGAQHERVGGRGGPGELRVAEPVVDHAAGWNNGMLRPQLGSKSP